MTVIVYGPPACGKTRASGFLARHFGCDSIVDGWNGRDVLPPNCLALTVEKPALQGARVFAFHDAMLHARGR
jgi:hypothetical protein